VPRQVGLPGRSIGTLSDAVARTGPCTDTAAFVNRGRDL